MSPTEFATSTPFSSPPPTAGRPRPSALDAATPVKGEKAQRAAEVLQIETLRGLFAHLPRDRREAQTIAALAPDETATVVAEVRTVTSRPVRRRGMKPMVVATVADATGIMEATFFNQPWLASRYPPGTKLILTGKYQARNRFRVSGHAMTQGAVGAEVATYPATEGLGSDQILELVRDHRPLIKHTVEPLPARVRAVEGMPDLPAALDEAHFGTTDDGRRRLAFDELLFTQLAFLKRRASRREHARSLVLGERTGFTKAWTDALPFTLTEDQARAMATIDEDLADDRPMQRLLMGEVGSGKTVVAVYAMLRAVESGAQAALMAPTETLAEQHFATLQKLIGPGHPALTSVALLTGATPQSRRRDLLAKLGSGELQLLVGTHALIEEPVLFDRLAVAVVDEQHRFGVNQRRALDRKGPGELTPHVLHMTATPIPRTQALTAYGDLDTTILKELPAGRRPITTHVANTQSERARAYERIEEELDAGRQAFVVCPLVEASEALGEARAATVEYERLQHDVFPDRRLALLHGRMTSAEKGAAMLAFAAGGADVLVATTVIEVGIDVPNATVMLVEDAERFGISQLHQLRGRVGRGAHASVCLLFGAKESRRLKALAEHSDGFRLAEIDLELRGEGELIGVRQSGMGAFRYAQLPEDAGLLARARHTAKALVDELDDHPLLAAALEDRFGAETLQPIPA